MSMPRKPKNNPEIFLDRNINLRKDFSLPTPEEWREEAEKSLKGGSFEEKLIYRTHDGLDLQPVYSKEDIKDLKHMGHFPGFSPYVRGARVDGYIQKPWDICQKIDADSVEEFNQILIHDLHKGQTAINLVLDISTQMGQDTTTLPTEKYRGNGISISVLSEFSTALSGLDLKEYPLFINAGYSALPMIMMLVAAEKHRGDNLKVITGSIEADPLGLIGLKGRLPVSLESAFDQMGWVLKWSREKLPELKTIGVDVSSFHDAGATATMELAFALATGVEYINQLQERNFSVDSIARSMRFTFGVGPFFFMEVAKLRAARMLWVNVIKEYGGIEEAQKMTIHARTAFQNQTRYDTHLNMIRTTTEAFSAVLGGVDSLQTNAFDESFSIPDEFSRRIARNTQLILFNETHLHQPIDPAGGSYYVERLSSEIAGEAWTIFQTIEKNGGMLQSLKTGFVQNQVSRIKKIKQKDVSCLNTRIVGTNVYANHQEEKIDLSESNTENRAIYQRIERLRKFRKSRDNQKCDSCLKHLSLAISTDEARIVSSGAEAFLNGATIGEVSPVLNVPKTKSILIPTIQIERMSESFELLRFKLEKHTTKTGNRPAFFLVPFGDLSRYRSGADFSKSILEIVGFDIVFPDGFNLVEQAVESAAHSGAQAVVVCPDDVDSEIVLEFVTELKQRKPGMIMTMAGNPVKHRSKLEENGIEAFIYAGVDAYQILKSLMIKLRIFGE